jgi:predicted permease
MRFDAVHDLGSDVRYGIRALARNPGFSVTVIGVLALGIGLNIAVFTLLKSFALSPVSGVEGSSRLAVIVGETTAARSLFVSYPDYQALRGSVRAFSELYGMAPLTANLGRGRSARTVWGELVTSNYFRVLGIRAQLGRTLLASDEVAPGAHPVVVMSDGLWRRDFRADPNIVGKTIEVNNHQLTVVGVTDPEFHGTLVSWETELIVPVMMAAQMGVRAVGSRASSANVHSDRSVRMLVPHGYLRPGFTVADASAQVASAWATLSRDRPLLETSQRLRVLPFWRSPFGGQTFALPLLAVLSATGLLILAITCANLSGILLARGASRRGDIAVRQALGATRTRNIRMLTIESFLIALPGAALGLLFAWRSMPPLIAFFQRAAAPQRIFLNVEIDGLVIGFALLVACGSALVFGFIPALRSSRVDLTSAMKEDVSPCTVARGSLRASLVVGQVAVSFVLLVGAGLATRSFLEAQQANRGFDARQVTSVLVDLKANAYDEARGRIFYERLLEVARAAPGVESATLAEYTPLVFIGARDQRVAIGGYDGRRGEDMFFLTNNVASDYFRTLRINMLAGRGFENQDDEMTAPVAVVNETLARRFWRSPANAVGRRLMVGDSGWRTVVGVAADVKYQRIDEAPRPYVYIPLSQSYRPTMILHTRGRAPLAALVEQARGLVAAVDPDVPVVGQSLADATSGALLIYRLMAAALFIFGVAGMALAAMGTYGLVSYTVKQSTREIGIRTALGASALVVARGFLQRGLRLGAVGAGLGILTALGVSRLLSRLLFGVSGTDALSFALAMVIVLGAVIAASIIPAWRATRTDPLSALRYQ